MHICMDRRKPLLNLKAWQIVNQYKVIIHFFQQGLPYSINKLKTQWAGVIWLIDKWLIENLHGNCFFYGKNNTQEPDLR